MSEAAVKQVEVGGEARLFVGALRFDESALVACAVYEAALFVVVELGVDVSFEQRGLLEGGGSEGELIEQGVGSETGADQQREVECSCGAEWWSCCRWLRNRSFRVVCRHGGLRMLLLLLLHIKSRDTDTRKAIRLSSHPCLKGGVSKCATVTVLLRHPRSLLSGQASMASQRPWSWTSPRMQMTLEAWLG